MELARSTKLKHKIGGIYQTPILVPSFSSKGLGFISKDEALGFDNDSKTEKVSEANEIMGTASEVITETMLVSAFDIAQGFIPKPENLVANPELIFVDSGGYETSNYYDFSDMFKGPPYLLENDGWTPEKHVEVLSEWPEHLAGVFISFDQNAALAYQVEDAQKLFSGFPDQLSDFLIKPEIKGNKEVKLTSILPVMADLKHFDIIGITEKELGNSMLKRMTNLAKLRLALDSEGITAPIHVFGSLDPITTCLYFLAGGEIFDGLTWSRFAYWDSTAIYKPNYGASQIGIHASDDIVRARTLFDNIYYLQKLQYKMQEFAVHKDFSVFSDVTEGGNLAGFLEKSYKTLLSKLK